MTTTERAPLTTLPVTMDVAFLFFSGFGSEGESSQQISADSEFIGEADIFSTIASGVLNLFCASPGSTAIYHPYSALPAAMDQLLALFDSYKFVIPIGHSYGGAAVKWFCDRLNSRSIYGRVPIVVLLDGVAEQFRFDEIFNARMGDASESSRWGIPVSVAPKAVQIFQRVNIPEGNQIRSIKPPDGKTVPSHWNVPAPAIGNASDGHCDIPVDPAIQKYVIGQVDTAIHEAIQMM